MVRTTVCHVGEKGAWWAKLGDSKLQGEMAEI